MMMDKKNSGDVERAPFSSGATKGTTGGATTAFPSPAGGVDEVRGNELSRMIHNIRTCGLDLIISTSMLYVNVFFVRTHTVR